MKKIKWMLVIALLSLSVYLLLDCQTVSMDKKAYLKEVLARMDTIRSATYFSISSASAPGDTLSFSEPRRQFFREFVNPDDSDQEITDAINRLL